MIKAKVLNPFKDRNEPTFRPLIFIRDMLYTDYSIELTTDDDFDFMFVGMSDFFDKDKSLKESTEWGLENLNKVTEGGDYFLFDGQDSTSIMGSYEVFEQSDAIYMFKNQLLQKRKDYDFPYPLPIKKLSLFVPNSLRFNGPLDVACAGSLYALLPAL